MYYCIILLHLYFHTGPFLFYQGLYLPKSLLDQLMRIDVLLPDRQVLYFDRCCAQQSFDLSLEMLRLILDNGRIPFQTVRLLGNGILREDIRSDLHDGQWCLELVSEIVDKILLDLRQEFLPVEIKEAGGKTDQCNEQDYRTHDPEIHLFQNIFMP